MTRVALDSNLLIYAELEPESEKGTRSAALILRAARDGVIPAQVLGEYLRFVQRRAPAAFEDAMRQATLYQAAFLTPPTTDAVVNKAACLRRGDDRAAEEAAGLLVLGQQAFQASAQGRVTCARTLEERCPLCGVARLQGFDKE